MCRLWRPCSCADIRGREGMVFGPSGYLVSGTLSSVSPREQTSCPLGLLLRLLFCPGSDACRAPSFLVQSSSLISSPLRPDLFPGPYHPCLSDPGSKTEFIFLTEGALNTPTFTSQPGHQTPGSPLPFVSHTSSLRPGTWLCSLLQP